MFGSHLSVAGGMHKALLEAESLGMDCVQVFTKNQQQWKAPPLKDDAVRAWSAELARLGWQPTDSSPGRAVSHASYLINLASPDDELRAKSIDLMTIEVERCEALGIPFLVFHPGAATCGDPAAGIRRIAESHREIFKRTKGFRTVSCLENTVGAGTVLGRTFDELRDLRDRIAEAAGAPERLGFCFDTCHAHAAGYDLSSRASADAALAELDALCGLASVRVVHMNDSVGRCGSRKDRHAHIGEGDIAKPADRPKQPLKDSGFAAVVNHPAFANVPKILETPKGAAPDGTPHDTLNLRRLRRLLTT